MSFYSQGRYIFSPGLSHHGNASDWCALQEALYKCIDTIQYNTIYHIYIIYIYNIYNMSSVFILHA